MIPTIVTRDKTTMAREKKALATSRASSLDFWVRYSVNTGMKEEVRDPSPRSLLNMFGILKATKKASAAIPAPNRVAIKASLTKPSIRLINVAPPTTPAALAILDFSSDIFLNPFKCCQTYQIGLSMSMKLADAGKF